MITAERREPCRGRFAMPEVPSQTRKIIKSEGAARMVRPRVMRLRGQFVYRLYDVGGRPLYIGATGDPLKRLGDHRRTASWWALVADMKFTGPFTDRKAALQFEAQRIMLEKPRFNTLHHPRPDVPPVLRVVSA